MPDEVPPNTPPPGTPPKTETPPAPTEAEKERDRLLTENAQARKDAKDAKTRADLADAELANLKKAGHKTSGDWKTVAETAEAEAISWKKKFETANSAFIGTLTGAKVREEALKNGFKADLVDLLDTMDFDEIEATIDENNRFNVKGADQAITNLKKLRPSLFDAAKAPDFNPGGPAGGKPIPPKGLEEAKAAYLTAHKNRFKDPQAFNQAQLVYQKAIFEAKRAKKQ